MPNLHLPFLRARPAAAFAVAAASAFALNAASAFAHNAARASAIPTAARADDVLVVTTGDAPTGARLLSADLHAYALPVPAGVTVAAAAARLSRRPGIVLAEPDRLWRAAFNAVGCTTAPAQPFTQASTIVDAPAPGAVPAATIAVLDTGVDDTVPELAGHVLPAINVTGDGSPADGTGHGTAVASVAAASSGLVRGVASGAGILPVKVLGDTGAGTTAWLVAGIDAAVRAHAKVINMSVAAPVDSSTTAEDRLVELAIGMATASGATVVAPTGNTGQNELQLPSAFPHVVSVAASTLSLQPASFSTWGQGVDIAAPGDMLTVAAPRAICGSGYGEASGTSFAAPAVSAAGALLAASRPGLTPSQRFEVLLASANPLTPSDRPYFGDGLLDVAGALHSAAPHDSGSEPDDEIYWVRRYPRAHPAVLGPRRRKASFTSYLGQVDEPADVLPLRLSAGDTLRAQVRVAAGQRPQLVLYSPKAGNFDVGDGVARWALAVSGRFGTLATHIGRSGLYYLAVASEDGSVPLQRYTLSLRRTPRRRQ